MAETKGDPAPVETRRGRHEAPPLDAIVAEPAPRPVVVGSTIAGSGLLAVSGYAGRIYVVLAVVFAGMILAWGWAELVGSTSPRASRSVLLFGTAALAASALVVDREPALRLMPIALAGSLVLIFVLQLARADDRAHLTHCMAGDALGIALLASAMAFAPLADLRSRELPVGMAAAAIAAGVLPDLLLGRPAVRAWLLPLSMALGAGAAILVSRFAPAPVGFGVAALIGVLAAGCGHAMRSVLSALNRDSARASLVISVSGLAVSGFGVYTVATLLIG